MAVFTKVTFDQLSPWLKTNYNLELDTKPQPITEGIENTNYCITCDGKKYIFTVVEVWDKEVANFCISLAIYLNQQQTAVPLTLTSNDNDVCPEYNNKPASVTEFVEGKTILKPSIDNCKHMGETIASLHTAAQDFSQNLPNQRNSTWRIETANQLSSTLDQGQLELLKQGFAAQRDVDNANLPQAACHCDLFRNNVLWDNQKIVGIIDFFFAGVDTLIFDLAVACNDWCMDDEGNMDLERVAAMINAYRSKRQFSSVEIELLPDAFCVAALRFWLSRMYDVVKPRKAHALIAHNPDAFANKLTTTINLKSKLAEIANQ